MNRNEAIKKSGLPSWLFDDCVRRCAFISVGQGHAADYTDAHLKLFRIYTDAKENLKAAKLKLGNGRIIHVRGRHRK